MVGGEEWLFLAELVALRKPESLGSELWGGVGDGGEW